MKNFEVKINQFISTLWGWALTIGMTCGVMAFAIWTIKLVLRQIGVI